MFQTFTFFPRAVGSQSLREITQIPKGKTRGILGKDRSVTHKTQNSNPRHSNSEEEDKPRNQHQGSSKKSSNKGWSNKINPDIFWSMRGNYSFNHIVIEYQAL